MFFFFSSRRRHTRSKRDWSSDVCSSDLVTSPVARRAGRATGLVTDGKLTGAVPAAFYVHASELATQTECARLDRKSVVEGERGGRGPPQGGRGTRAGRGVCSTPAAYLCA